MCGIAGCVLNDHTPPSAPRLAAMRDALRHRGPDGAGIKIVGNVGLVHTRLAIVDPTERAHQPVHHPAGEWWLSFNGEIFNHLELRRKLGGGTLFSPGDTETLLRALDRWGPAVLDRLNGQFAFAALDLKRRRLLLARDRFGIKPLYVAETDEGIWFASEPQALLAVGIAPRLRAASWQRILEGACYGGERTLLEGVDRLPPGACASISLDAPRLDGRLWARPSDQVDPDLQRQLQGRSRRRLADALEGGLREAVRNALLGDVPIGTLCSGGVDSAVITALAAEAGAAPIAFGARYRGDPALDEGPAAARVAAACGVELDMLTVTEAGWRSGFVAATAHFGAPLANASAVTVAQLAQRARTRGIKVLLTGEGADELFAGYDSLHRDLLTAFLPPTARSIRRFEPLLSTAPAGGRAALAIEAVRALGRGGSGPDWSTLTRAEASKEHRGANTRSYGDHPGSRGALEDQLLGSLDYTLCHLLNRMDKNMMQCSVEARVPFLDPNVVTLALNLPLEVRVGPWHKGLLRDVARRVLPWKLAHRPKVYGMDFDAGAWIEAAADQRFLRDGVLREVFELSTSELTQTLAQSSGALRVRIWSTEVWCRAVLAGHEIPEIERALWPSGP
jgi:asparagine synthase (glutamine-hydrolysing)